MTSIENGTIHVFTYKEGLLSKVAHDLRLSLGRFSVEVDGEELTALFKPDSLKVDGVIKKGRLDTRTLSAKDSREILDNTFKDVLKTGKHPEIRFTGSAIPVNETASGYRISGRLDMLGKTNPVNFDLNSQNERLKGRVTLIPSKWGIKPFKALMGAIKVKDRVLLEFDLPMGE